MGNVSLFNTALVIKGAKKNTATFLELEGTLRTYLSL